MFSSAHLDASHRRVCYRCHKPRVTCVCARIVRVHNRTPVFILQHPRERLHPIGTARIAALGLTNVRVEVAWNAGTREDQCPAWLPSGAVLLYPAKEARDLSDVSPSERPTSLIVLDGTWHTARTLYRDKRWLQDLPRYRFSPPTPSRYRIRREPAAHCVSSIEAIVAALSMLEPDTSGLATLLDAFDGMIDDQLARARAVRTKPRRFARKRPAELRHTPRALAEDFHRLIVVYGETTRSDSAEQRALVQWTAVALGTGASFERIVKPPSGLPPPEQLVHMELDERDFVHAVDVRTFRRDWQSFLERCGERPVIAAWNQNLLDLLACVTGGRASRAALKGMYRTRHGAGSGSLDDVIARERLNLVPLSFRGRAAVRTASAVAIAHHLNARQYSLPSS